MAEQTGSSRAAATIASVLVALLFLLAGGTKLMGRQSHAEQFAHWGYPVWTMYIVGLFEVGGAVGVLIPSVRFYAAVLLACNKVGAVFTHYRNAELLNIPLPALLGLSAALIAWVSRPSANAANTASDQD